MKRGTKEAIVIFLKDMILQKVGKPWAVAYPPGNRDLQHDMHDVARDSLLCFVLCHESGVDYTVKIEASLSLQ